MTGITIELTFSDRPRRSIPIKTEALFKAVFRNGPLLPFSRGVWHQATDYDWPFKVNLYHYGIWMKGINFVDHNGLDPPVKETGWERFYETMDQSLSVRGNTNITLSHVIGKCNVITMSHSVCIAIEESFRHDQTKCLKLLSNLTSARRVRVMCLMKPHPTIHHV